MSILTVQTDGKEIGSLRVRGGKIEATADSPGAKEWLERTAEMYARNMVTHHGYTDPTADDVLRFMADRMHGRTSAHLET